MLIDCPGCAKSYHIIRAALGPNGRRVACPRCDTIWLVAPEGLTDSFEPNIPATIEISAQDIALRTPAERPREAPVTRVRHAPAARARGRSGFLKNLCAGTALLACGMALIGFRAEIVQAWPAASTAYAALGLPVNLRGLELRNLHTVLTHEGAEAVLGIEGEIANVRLGDTEVPPIELTICDADGLVLYTWTAKSQKRRLAGGEIILFRARLAAPPPDGREVLARFAPDAPETLAWR
jgi:predicted Zn finger-like uncharacterized protein